MNCSEAEQLFDAFLDKELAGSLQLELDAHRLRCLRCQQTLAMMEACEHVVATDKHGPEVADDFTARVMAEVEQSRPQPRIIRFKRVAVAAGILVPAAAAVLVAMIGFPNQSEAPPTHDLNLTPSITDRIGDAFAANDRDEGFALLYETIDDGVAQLLAARSNLTNGLNQLTGYAMNISLPRETDVMPIGSPLPILDWITRFPLERETSPPKKGAHSL